MFKFLFKWSLQITGSALIGYNYFLSPDKQANLYGLYRSSGNSYRALKHLYKATSDYKGLLSVKQNPEEYAKQLKRLNQQTSKRIYELSKQNKGVYMRMGQYISHLSYCFPSEITEKLHHLNEWNDFQKPDYQYLKKHIENHLGMKTKEAFESLNTIPMHTDLFYQVYKGQLLENFLDITLKVMHPYAQSEAKYDLMFLQKATDYINKFQDKHFSQSQPLMLKTIYQNLKADIDRELNFKEQQKVTAQIRQNLIQNPQQTLKAKATKMISRSLPVYIPHRYSKYITQKVAIHQHFEGENLKNPDLITTTSTKMVASDYVSVWNMIVNNTGIINESIRENDIMVRKSRPNQQGQYQFCPMNFTKRHQMDRTLVDVYSKLWKSQIQGLKPNKKKSDERRQGVEQFYSQLPNALFLQALKSQELLQDLQRQTGIQTLQNIAQIETYTKNKLSKKILSKLEPKYKTKNTIDEVEPSNYRNLRKAFEIKYQPWKFEALLTNYKEIFGRRVTEFGLPMQTNK